MKKFKGKGLFGDEIRIHDIMCNNKETTAVYLSDKPLETKIFEKGEHVITLRVKSVVGYDLSSTSYIPFEGYEIINVNKVSYDSGSYRLETFVTYKNTQRVKVNSVYNKETETYDYSQIGSVVKKLTNDDDYSRETRQR